MNLTVLLLLARTLSAQASPSAQEKEVVEWVIRSLIQQQKYSWNDWSRLSDRRAVLISNLTIPFPKFADDDYALNYAAESLKAQRGDLYAQLGTAPKHRHRRVDTGTGLPLRSGGSAGSRYLCASLAW